MRSFVLAAVLSVGLATTLSAVPIGVYSTGVCAGANGCGPGLLAFGVPDLNYTFSGFSTSGNPITESAISTYVADNVGASEWLTPPGGTPTGMFPGAPTMWTATTTFNLSGFDPTTLTLFLDIAADNDIVAALNGTTILSCLTGGSTCFSAFTSNHSISAGSIALAGLNTLTFTITNENDPSETAFRVQVSGDAALAAVPEPGTWALLGFGLAGLGLLRRKIA